MNVFQERCEPVQVEASGTAAVDAKILPGDLLSKCELLQVDKACSAFEVGQSGGVAALQALEFSAARDLKFQGVHELRVVPLQDLFSIV
ncbi:hypothetical protein EV128_102315 [Rhizobium azibense]|nr:hypothetical protein EV128_102315 [Rhizobium azibense]